MRSLWLYSLYYKQLHQFIKGMTMPQLAHNTKTSPMSLRVTEDKKARLTALAQIKERSQHSLAVKAIDEYIEREEARLAYEQQAVRAYENMQATGLHVTADELKTWANSLNTSNPEKAPKCHV